MMLSNPVECEGDNRGDDQVRQFAADELLGVGDPFVQNLAHKPAFGEPPRPHCQKNCNHTNSSYSYLYCAESGYWSGVQDL